MDRTGASYFGLWVVRRPNLILCLAAMCLATGLTAPAESVRTPEEIRETLGQLPKPVPGELFTGFRGAMRTAVEGPNTQVATHNIGNIQVGHTNLGQFGTGFVGSILDPITGEALPSCTFPANSNRNHLYVAAFWIGAIIGRDTLVSSGADDGFAVHEFWPGAEDEIIHRSIIPTDRFFDPAAVSEQ
ncbi:MAG: hypothetical protein ACE5GA_05335, partial [Candidatus Zixiibacteriota bacterium]